MFRHHIPQSWFSCSQKHGNLLDSVCQMCNAVAFVVGDYAGFPGCGLLRLHSTYRHDLKIYASDEGRVQMTAAAFAKVCSCPQSTMQTAYSLLSYLTLGCEASVTSPCDFVGLARPGG